MGTKREKEQNKPKHRLRGERTRNTKDEDKDEEKRGMRHRVRNMT